MRTAKHGEQAVLELHAVNGDVGSVYMGAWGLLWRIAELQVPGQAMIRAKAYAGRYRSGSMEVVDIAHSLYRAKLGRVQCIPRHL